MSERFEDEAHELLSQIQVILDGRNWSGAAVCEASVCLLAAMINKLGETHPEAAFKLCLASILTLAKFSPIEIPLPKPRKAKRP